MITVYVTSSIILHRSVWRGKFFFAMTRMLQCVVTEVLPEYLLHVAFKQVLFKVYIRAHFVRVKVHIRSDIRKVYYAAAGFVDFVIGRFPHRAGAPLVLFLFI